MNFGRSRYDQGVYSGGTSANVTSPASLEASNAGDQVDLSVVLCVYNGEPFLERQLKALAAQVCDVAWELIVVDNNSTDTSAETARSFSQQFSNLQIIFEAKKGKACALNRAKRAVNGIFVVFVDADDEVESGYLQSMVNALGRYEMVSAIKDSELLNPPWGRVPRTAGNHSENHLGYLPYVGGAEMGVRTETWLRIGDFDATLMSGEDVDFSWRAHSLGVTMGMAPGAILQYRRPPDAWGNFRKARSYGRAHVWLFARYREHGMPRQSGVSFVRFLVAILRQVVRHEDHWRWRASFQVGLLVGRLEESMRLRIWYP